MTQRKKWRSVQKRRKKKKKKRKRKRRRRRGERSVRWNRSQSLVEMKKKCEMEKKIKFSSLSQKRNVGVTEMKKGKRVE